MKVLFKKTRVVKTPFRANANDAGIDFFLPQMNELMVKAIIEKNPGEKCLASAGDRTKNPFITIRPGARVLIPSGIHTALEPKNSALVAFNKSGLASKKGIIVTAQVVDSDYTGEIHVGLLNTSDEYVEFRENEKIGQFVHIPIYLTDLEQISESMYEKLTSKSDRGAGGFGSTDKDKK